MKRQCINNPKYMYSGKESSPLGLGITAEPLVLGTIQEGRDKTNWIVTLKNGIKVWSRITRLSEIREKEQDDKENIVQEPSASKKKAPARKKPAATTVPKATTSTSQDTEPIQDITDIQNTADKEQGSKEPVKRKPTNYNIYMKYKLKQLVKEETNLKPKERIAHAVALWQSMTNEEKEEIVKEAKIALENGDI